MPFLQSKVHVKLPIKCGSFPNMRVNTGFNIDPCIEKLSGVKEIALISISDSGNSQKKEHPPPTHQKKVGSFFVCLRSGNHFVFRLETGHEKNFFCLQRI